jgi:hypothetical protein
MKEEKITSLQKKEEKKNKDKKETHMHKQPRPDLEGHDAEVSSRAVLKPLVQARTWLLEEMRAGVGIQRAPALIALGCKVLCTMESGALCKG